LNKERKPGAIHRVIFFIIIAVSLSAGCSLFRTHGPAPTVLKEDFSLLDPKDFPEKIKQLEDISQNDKSMSVRTRALFYIALAHMHYKNPSPDYSKAAEYLDKYIALSPDNKDVDEIVAWKSTLLALDSSLQERKKLEGSYAQLKKEYERATNNRGSLNKKINDLGQVIANQNKEIESLKETIKKLDAVQQEIEKKKKGIKR
jgi:outer membrane protein assembly factor BamD (BamD/ComL family)